MAKSILIYNMPEDKKAFLEREAIKHNFEIIEATNEDLCTKVNILLKEEQGEKEYCNEDGVDINFLMINKFNNQILNRFIKDMQKEEIYIPNKCVTTEHNVNWPLKKLLLENKEEHEVMTIYKDLSKLRSKAIKIYKENDDKELYETLLEVTDYMQPKEFDKNELIRRYDNLKNILNRISPEN